MAERSTDTVSTVPIRTPDHRLRVFVSSTLGELAEERAAVRRAIESLRLTPVMFELGARPHPPRALYRAYLEQSHVFVGLYWQRYGWVAPDEVVSGLDDEYVLSAGMPRLVYVKRPAADQEERLAQLLSRIQRDDQLSYRAFGSTEELEQLVKDDLVVLLTERFEAVQTKPSAMSWRPTPPPLPSTPTYGREDDIAAVASVLDDGVRLLTLVGPGGVGKSRFALEVCRRVRDRYRDGIAFVALESVTEPGEVMRVLARSVGAPLEGNQPALDAVTGRLKDRVCLLLVDNFEQVVAAGPELGMLIDSCPGVQALVTSRRPLHLRGEREHQVAPLEVPPGDDVVADRPMRSGAAGAYPSVELFVGRAQAVRPGFEVDAHNERDVASLVRSLDGLPLALELAAARMRVLPPRALLQRLVEDQRVLGTAAVDVPERQRTLQTTLEWSHGLLTPNQQRLLARMSVFTDGATLDAVEAVCGDGLTDSLADVSALLENNLILHASESFDGQPRLTMLTTVHTYAQERLTSSAEAVSVRARLIDWFMEQASHVDMTLGRAAHLNWPLLLPDVQNLRTVVQLLVEQGDCARLTAFVWHLYPFVWQSGYPRDVREWLERLEALDCTHDAAHRGRAVAMIGVIHQQTGDYDGALAALTSVDVDAFEATDPAGAAVLHVTLAITLPRYGRIDEAAVAAERAVATSRACGFAFLEGYALAHSGMIAFVRGDTERGLEFSRSALELGSELELWTLIAQQHGILAFHAAVLGDPRRARDHLRTARSLLGGARSANQLAALLGHAAVLALTEGRIEAACRALACSDAILQRFGLARWPLYELLQRGSGLDQAVLAHVGDGYAALVADMQLVDPWTLYDQIVGTDQVAAV